MRPNSARQFLLAVTFVLATVSLPAEEPDAPADAASTQRYSLRYKFTADQMLRFAIGNESTVSAQVGNFADSVEQQSTTTKRYRVKSMDDSGNADLEVTIERVQLKAQAGDEKIEYDSDSNDPVPEALKGIKGTIGTPRGTIRLAGSGKVIDFELAEAGPTVAEIKDSHMDVMPLLPDQPVGIGETWKEDYSVDVLIDVPPFKKPIQLQRVYSLRSVEGGVATIDERTFVLTPIRDPKVEGQLIRRPTSGTSTIDLERGLLLKRELSVDNRVIGFEGPNTSMHVQETHEDRYLPAEQLVRAPDEKTATK